MQRKWTYLGALLALMINTSWLNAQIVSIDPNGAAPDSSAILDIAASDKGILLPRMDSTARMNIMNPAEGLMVYDSSYHNFFVYDGTTWAPFGVEKDNLGNHTATQNLQLNNNWLNNDGGANEGINVNNAGQLGIGVTPDANLRVAMGNSTILDAHNTLAVMGLNYDVCQSFTALNTGELHSIELLAYSPGAVMYNLYEGSGRGGTRLAGPLNQANAQDPYLFSGITLTAGQVYTIEIVNGGISYGFHDENPYSGGDWCITSGADLWFKVNLSVPKPGFKIGDNQIQINDYSLPTTDGTAGQTFSTNGAGTTTWIDVTNSDNQDLNLAGNILSVTNDPTAVNLGGYLDNTDHQNLNLSGNTLSLSNDATTVDLSSYLDNTDAQDLNLAGNTLSLSNDATTVDLSGYLDNTDAQDLNLSGNTLSLTNDATTVDLSGYMDNTDAQDLSLSGSILSLSNDATTVDVSVLGADELGNHTATQNVRLNNNWLNNDGGASKGININNNGQVGINTIPTADFHMDMGAGENINPVNISNDGTTLSIGAIWQSFTTPRDGDLISITTALSNVGGVATYRFFSGEGLSGGFLYESTISCVNGDNTFTFSGVTLAKDQVYTFYIVFPLSTPHTCNLNSTNPYPGGRASNNASHDWAISVTTFIANEGFKVESTGVTINQYTLPINDGAANQVLTTDGNSNVSWAAVPANVADNMGNHTASQNIQLNNNWLSNDGGNEGININNTGSIGLGRAVGTVGAAKLEQYGPSGSHDGPHTQVVGSTDDYPLFQQLNWTHDNIALTFDAYYDAGWHSSNSAANFSIYKALGKLINFVSSANAPGTPVTWAIGTSLDTLGRFGIGRNPTTNLLEVEGNASKAAAGSWFANSDARLKKNIKALAAEETLNKLLALQGVSYEWNDKQTGSQRPEGIQYGFTAQNIQEVFPTLVTPDNQGFLQTPYGTYDAMTVEALRALNDKISQLEIEKANLQTQLSGLQSKNQELKSHAAALTELEASFAALKSKLRQKSNRTDSAPALESEE